MVIIDELFVRILIDGFPEHQIVGVLIVKFPEH